MIETAREKIEEVLGNNSLLMQNVITKVLRDVAKEHGQQAANKLIIEYELERRHGIPTYHSFDKGKNVYKVKGI